MKELNITEGPWVIQFEAMVCSVNRLIADCGDYGFTNSENINESKANAKAIVTAVNNTYHKGIDPEGVEDMKEALILAKDELSHLYDIIDIEAESTYAIKEIKDALKKAGVNLYSKAE